jgi:hypothetical protein
LNLFAAKRQGVDPVLTFDHSGTPSFEKQGARVSTPFRQEPNRDEKHWCPLLTQDLSTNQTCKSSAATRADVEHIGVAVI